jgi:hypothetical protein
MSDPAADETALLDFLRDRDVACPLCRYNLRALTSPRCPECGRELRLTIGLVEPRQGAWLTGQIALTAPAGIGLMIIIVSAFSGWPEGNSRQGLMDFAFLFHIAMIPAAAAWLVGRRRYMRLSRRIQWSGAALAIAAVVTGMILLAAVTD